MNDTTKRKLAVVGLIIALVLLWFFLRSKPGLIRQLENAIAPAAAGVFDIPLSSAYTPHDFPLPPIDTGNAYVNFGCSFCSKTNVSVVLPPSMPISAPASPTPMQIYPQQPFGGGGYYGTMTLTT